MQFNCCASVCVFNSYFMLVSKFIGTGAPFRTDGEIMTALKGAIVNYSHSLVDFYRFERGATIKGAWLNLGDCSWNNDAFKSVTAIKCPVAYHP